MKKIKMKASPLGEFKVAFLDRPSKKYDTFSAVLVLESDAVFPKTGKTIPKFIEELEEALTDFIAQDKAENPKRKKWTNTRLPIQPEEDENGDETGRYILKAKQNATIKIRKTGEERQMKVDLFDARGKPMEGVAIGRGSSGRIAGTIAPYAMDFSKEYGLTMYLEGAKIVNLVDASSGTADSYGFDEEEEGYGYEEDTVTDGLDGDESESGDDDGDGDF